MQVHVNKNKLIHVLKLFFDFVGLNEDILNMY